MCALSPPKATNSAPTFFGAPQVADEVLAARPAKNFGGWWMFGSTGITR